MHLLLDVSALSVKTSLASGLRLVLSGHILVPLSLSCTAGRLSVENDNFALVL